MADTISRLFLFLMTLRSTGHVFCRISLVEVLSDVSWLDWGYMFMDEDHKDKGPLSSHYIKAIY